MKVLPLQTDIIHQGDQLLAILDSVITSLPERSIVAVTSKIIALCEGNTAPLQTGTKEEKQQVVRQTAEWYTEPSASKYGTMLTIKDHILSVNGGVDESNADGKYVLLPKDSYASAEYIWRHLRAKHQVTQLGVVVTDSRAIPLKWGVIGTCLAHCGFQALDNRIGTTDLFGHQLQMTQINVAEALAISAVFLMGETDEAQPIALITELPESVTFQAQPPTAAERQSLVINPADDVFAPLLEKADWQAGKKS